MTDFDKLQALVDEVYTEWRKEENKGKEKWDILGNFSPAHQIAVAFGNFNYQVENGGLNQWIYNGYFHDDAEKFTEFLEAGKELDERCGEILKKVYQVDQCAQDTDCDRNGYFIDPDDDDDEGGFIGDMVNSDKFDTWYYAHCGNDDWWKTVADIIKKVDGRDLSQIVSQDERDGGEPAPPQPTLRVYIENDYDTNIGGVTVPLPITKDDLQPFLESAGISDWHDIRIEEISSDIEGVGGELFDIVYTENINPSTLDELNYFAARFRDLDETEREIIAANIEAGKNNGCMAELINLTFAENISCFDIQPARDAKMYGEFLVDMVLSEEHGEAIVRLEKSEDPADRALADYIEKLEGYADKAAIGRDTAKEEGGVFTRQGYLVGRSDLERLYRDSADIPDEHRLFTDPENAKGFIMKIDDTNIPEAIMKLHAVGCKSMEHAAKNVQVFLDEHNRLGEDKDGEGGNHLSNHYLLILNRNDICIAPAMEAYKWGSDMSKFTVSMTELAANGRSDIRVFAMRTNPNNGIDSGGRAEIKGDLIELTPKSLRRDMARHAVIPDRVDALHDDGTTKSYDLYSWAELLRNHKGEFAGSFSYHYEDNELKKAANRFGALMGSFEMASTALPFEEHLPRINAVFRDAPANAERSLPHPDMIYISKEAAKEILAAGYADVYRLSGRDAVRLYPVDAARTSNFSQNNDLAIRHKDAAGLEIWAKLKVSDVVRKMERETERQPGRDKKSRAEEL